MRHFFSLQLSSWELLLSVLILQLLWFHLIQCFILWTTTHWHLPWMVVTLKHQGYFYQMLSSKECLVLRKMISHWLVGFCLFGQSKNLFLVQTIGLKLSQHIHDFISMGHHLPAVQGTFLGSDCSDCWYFSMPLLKWDILLLWNYWGSRSFPWSQCSGS